MCINKGVYLLGFQVRFRVRVEAMVRFIEFKVYGAFKVKRI